MEGKDRLSKISTDYKNDSIILGIDEAGRGPVLGPMVYACAFYAEENNDLFKKEFGFADSKTLSEKQRESIYSRIEDKKNLLDFKFKVLHAQELSTRMLKKNRESLNEISKMAAFDLIRQCLSDKVNIKKVFIDTVGKPDSYQKLFEKEFQNSDIEFIVTTKADSKFPVVSAASIVAKVTRDRTIESWEFKEKPLNKEISKVLGSGYPGDPKTKTWLRLNLDKVFGLPSLVRFSWKTALNLLKGFVHKIKWYNNYKDRENYIDEDWEDEDKQGGGNVKAFFQKNAENIRSDKQKVLNYFDTYDLKFSNVLI